MSKRRGDILPAIALGTGLLAAMLPAQALAVTTEGPFESHHVKTVEAGGERGAAITSDGSLWIWGSNEMGQLGDGTTEDSLEPLKIMDNVVDVSLGDFETAAVTEDGSLWMWGGDDTDLEHKEIMDNVVDVELGAGHCAAITEDGSLYMWGFNYFGQVGGGTLEDREEPVEIVDDVVDVATSFGTTLAVTADGTVWGWGSNSDGEVGDGTTEKRTVPVKVMDGAVAVSAEFLTSSALGADGSLWMWGDNNNGSIGDGTEDEKTVPVKVMEGIKQVSLGTGHASAVAEDGSLWMWGTGYNGRLGNGTLENQLTPIRVMEGVQSVALGMTSTCVATEDGLLWTWGGNERGQPGDGTTEDRSTPARIQVGSACPAEAFEDVDLTMWYHDAIDWALEMGAMNGYEDGTFGPTDPLAREQAAGVLWNLLGNKDTSAPAATHADVDQNAWYTDAVNWAVANGYMNGYDGTDRFGIGNALTREQFACVIANAAGADLDAADSSAMSKLPDAGAVSDWAEDAMAWAVDLGVINGVETDNGRELQPGRTISRSEMAAMIMNAVACGALDI